jgi:hypothetical protein
MFPEMNIRPKAVSIKTSAPFKVIGNYADVPADTSRLDVQEDLSNAGSVYRRVHLLQVVISCHLQRRIR